ncbi:MAG: RES family NAD+ phosphorylase [Ferruginibacter sp.]|nr:RES family NAD+ phosphorylase [Bacteroidota bacterium]MBX2919995.1 RES family NAD+ phosphorylase [Ferruginibacter sp.]MCB0710103.1 RES family NAD+ phosphorylase [Chitinophagaceae bacterium]
MIVYRIVNSHYKNDISGIGAKLKGARWNKQGSSLLYTAEHISLCALELLVHIGFNDIQKLYHILSIYVPDDVSIKKISINKLKPNWIEDKDYTAFIGTEFINNNINLVLQVPSAIISEEHNYLINPNHRDFKKVKIKTSKPFIFDERLYTFK